MKLPLFPKGYRGLADSRWSGVEGSVAESVGVDAHSTPGLLKVHQKLTKDSSTTINELCKAAVPVSDGSKLWFSSESGKIWRELSGTYSLVYTNVFPGFDIRSASDAGKSFNYSAQVAIATGHFFKPDGTKMYVICNAQSSGNSGEIFQYSLSTPFDVSTASYDSKTFAADLQGTGMFISSDGTKLYVSEDGGANTVIEYTLSTAWDISTASASGSTYNFSAQLTKAWGIYFKSDGTEMYLWSQSDARIYQYTLSTGFDLSTASYTGFFATGVSMSYGAGMSDDGVYFYVASGTSSGIVYQYECSTPYDITTASAAGSYDTDGSKQFGFAVFPDGSGFVIAVQAGTETVYQYNLEAEDTNVANISADEFEGYVYWTTKNRLQRVAIADVDDFSDIDVWEFAAFTNGDDLYHPMIVQNASLFIGDKTTMAQVDNSHIFFPSTALNTPDSERIMSVERFDIDVVIGTSYGQYARILRWDTVSDSWNSEDIVFEDGISAFIRDDNYLYAYAGNQGRLYFYNGEKLERFTRIRGDWDASNTATVHAYSVGYYNGLPIFGLSTVAGTPCKMGVYSLGSFSPSYPIALDLAYPLGNTYDTLTFGALIVDGNDFYIAAEDGVYAIDHSNKYQYAHIETRQIPVADRRGTVTEYLAGYVSLPASTGITFSYRDRYDSSFVALTTVTDAKKEEQRAELSVPNITSLQLRMDFTVSSNDGPEYEVEAIGID